MSAREGFCIPHSFSILALTASRSFSRERFNRVTNYPHLPLARVRTTQASDYMTLLTEVGA